MTARELWDMGLFDEVTFTNNTREWLVLRVPGGWVMREAHVPSPAYVFVPLNNEFLGQGSAVPTVVTFHETALANLPRGLFVKIRDAFQSKNLSGFSNPAKAIEDLKWLTAEFERRWPDRAEEGAAMVVRKYWELRTSDDAFWKRQPFTPSRLRSHWDAVLTLCENDETNPKTNLDDVSWMKE